MKSEQRRLKDERWKGWGMKDEKCRGVLLQDGQTDRQTNKQTFVIAFETENFILLFLYSIFKSHF